MCRGFEWCMIARKGFWHNICGLRRRPAVRAQIGRRCTVTNIGFGPDIRADAAPTLGPAGGLFVCTQNGHAPTRDHAAMSAACQWGRCNECSRYAECPVILFWLPCLAILLSSSKLLLGFFQLDVASQGTEAADRTSVLLSIWEEAFCRCLSQPPLHFFLHVNMRNQPNPTFPQPQRCTAISWQGNLVSNSNIPVRTFIRCCNSALLFLCGVAGALELERRAIASSFHRLTSLRAKSVANCSMAGPFQDPRKWIRLAWL